MKESKSIKPSILAFNSAGGNSYRAPRRFVIFVSCVIHYIYKSWFLNLTLQLPNSIQFNSAKFNAIPPA